MAIIFAACTAIIYVGLIVYLGIVIYRKTKPPKPNKGGQ